MRPCWTKWRGYCGKLDKTLQRKIWDNFIRKKFGETAIFFGDIKISHPLKLENNWGKNQSNILQSLCHNKFIRQLSSFPPALEVNCCHGKLTVWWVRGSWPRHGWKGRGCLEGNGPVAEDRLKPAKTKKCENKNNKWRCLQSLKNIIKYIKSDMHFLKNRCKLSFEASPGRVDG